jgi:polyisoprenoid-binding protein YceI
VTRARRPLLRRRSTYFVAVPILVALLAAVVGPYVYIHLVEGPVPARLALEPAARPGGSGASRPELRGVDGAWRPTSGSRAGYRVHETLFGQGTTAVGRTEAVRGRLVISATTVESATFTVDLRTVSSDREPRDAQFRGRIMDTARFPNATFELSSPVRLSALPENLELIDVTARGRLTLHGTTRAVRVRLAARRNGTRIEINGSIPVGFADYGIPNPSLGPASTDDHGEIELLLVLEHAS